MGARGDNGQDAPDEEELTTPWHFKLLSVALVLYLIYRAVQLGVWALQQLF